MGYEWDVPSSNLLQSYWKKALEKMSLFRKHGGSFHTFLAVYQRVPIKKYGLTMCAMSLG